MADDCVALEFEMDCGHAFSEKYGDAGSNHESLNRIIDDIDDISLLSSAIYSQWRYFNHWAYSGEEILEPENHSWFILALERLAELTCREKTPLKIALISCSKLKQSYACPAQELYAPSQLFSLSYQYGKRIAGQSYILSAQYGLLADTDVVSPYDLTLADLPEHR